MPRGAHNECQDHLVTGRAVSSTFSDRSARPLFFFHFRLRVDSALAAVAAALALLALAHLLPARALIYAVRRRRRRVARVELS